MKKIFLIAFFAPLAAAHAQTTSAIVVPRCGGLSAPVMQIGQPYPITMDVNGNLCDAAVSASAAPAPAFNSPGPPVLNRWRANCNCFVSAP
jgi:hypothetical protein